MLDFKSNSQYCTYITKITHIWCSSFITGRYFLDHLKKESQEKVNAKYKHSLFNSLTLSDIEFTHIRVSVILFLSLVFFMLPVPPVIKVDRNPAGLQKERETSHFRFYIPK